MEDILARMRDEERELQRKLEAVRHFLAAYSGSDTASALLERAPRKPRPLAERMDKFGAYGQRVIDAALPVLPDSSEEPMRTRDIAAKLQDAGVKITGSNKVNSLSALLARSTKIKGYGREGWTRADGVTPPNENGALNGHAASAPEAEGVAPPSDESRRAINLDD